MEKNVVFVFAIRIGHQPFKKDQEFKSSGEFVGICLGSFLFAIQIIF